MTGLFLLRIAGEAFLLYLLVHIIWMLLSAAAGTYRMWRKRRVGQTNTELKHGFYFPVSILVPAHNHEDTILNTLESLLYLDYRLYEIVVVDDGSQDNTSQVVIDSFHLHKVHRPIRKSLPCQTQEEIYESDDAQVRITLIRKKQGGRGDALNMGINAAQFPYFLCVDPGSVLSKDALERMAQRVMEDDSVIGVGGLIRVAQCVHMEKGEVRAWRLPRKGLLCMQVMEYDRIFLASRLLPDCFNGNLTLSGGFGLFRKDVVVAAGGYDAETQGEDMELVIRLRRFCGNSRIPCSIPYETGAVCWCQVPERLGELCRQRRRWHVGLSRSMRKHQAVFPSARFGPAGVVSWLYHLLYERFSPQIRLVGLVAAAAAAWMGEMDGISLLWFFLLYAVCGWILTLTAFFQQICIQNLKIGVGDTVRACAACLAEHVFVCFFMDLVRLTGLLSQCGQMEEGQD